MKRTTMKTLLVVCAIAIAAYVGSQSNAQNEKKPHPEKILPVEVKNKVISVDLAQVAQIVPAGLEAGKPPVARDQKITCTLVTKEEIVGKITEVSGIFVKVEQVNGGPIWINVFQIAKVSP